MLKSALQEYPDTDITVHIVWVPMLGSDNHEAALEISAMFDDPRVHQYWDSGRLSGIAYAKDVYPTYIKDMRATLKTSLPTDHWWHQSSRLRDDVRPEQAPLWDVAFFYNQGTQWRGRVPRPTAMTKQIFFYRQEADGPTGMFFNDYSQPPIDGDWFTEVSKGMKGLTGKGPTVLAGQASDKTPTSTENAPGCLGATILIKMILLQIEGLTDASNADQLAGALRAVKGVRWATVDRKTGLAPVMADDPGPVTVERLIEFLSLAGYEAKEATEEQYEAESEKLRSAGPIVLGNIQIEDSLMGPTEGTVEVTSLADSLQPLRDRFNANQGKARLIALLSPT